jgi:eukaryotic-like serine/threonine-protein kinase
MLEFTSTPPAPVADLRERLQIGLADRYRIERELGRGGMATVFLAQDLRHKRPVALKVLHPELAHTLGPERFQREIETVARLQHPHILTVHDSGETAGQLWFTMPFVEGETLRERLRRERQLPLEDALRIATEAARALQYAHDHGVIHRDIKPENLLLTRDGSTLVADFGIARALSGGDDRLTETGLSVGTPTYMSPEQSAGDRHLDARTDVYSLGTVLYEMLVGEPPFTGATAQAVIARRFSGEVPRVRHVRPSVPESVEHAVTRALAPVAADRFSGAGDFARALATGATTPIAMSAEQGTTSGMVTSLRRRRLPVQLGMTALVLSFLLGLGVLFAWRRTHAGDEEGRGGLKRLAVLPFDNLGDTSEAYFAEGIAAEIRGKLSYLPSLTVIASTSSNQYRHTTKTLRQVAQELGVQYLVVGHVQWDKQAGSAGRVRVSPELVEAATGATKWQQPFDAALTDVFQVQADIAGRVAEALDVALGASERHVLAGRPTANLAAYDAFLQGEAASQDDPWDPLSLHRIIRFYEQAVALDSTFAPAWAQLARVRARLYWARTLTPALAEGSRLAAARAQALAPGQPESQLAWATYLIIVREDYAGALQAIETGLRVAPTNADLLTLAGTAELFLGRGEAAIQHIQRAQALDPRSSRPPSRLAIAFLSLGRWQEARRAADQALALSPASLDMLETKVETYIGEGDLTGAQAMLRGTSRVVEPAALVAYLATWRMGWVLDSAHQALLLRLPPAAFDDDRGSWGLALAETYALRGDQARARLYADSARLGAEEELRHAPKDPGVHTLLGVALGYLGRTAAAIREGERGVAINARDRLSLPYSEYQLARIYLLVGDPQKALDQLELLLKTPSYFSPAWLRIDPTFAPLRGDPRFERLVNGK